MIDIKIIILLIGLFFIAIGFINQHIPDTEKQIIYKIVPRNVYDEIFFSLPIVQYSENINKLVNPQFILDDINDYNSLRMDSSNKYDKYDKMTTNRDREARAKSMETAKMLTTDEPEWKPCSAVATAR